MEGGIGVLLLNPLSEALTNLIGKKKPSLKEDGQLLNDAKGECYVKRSGSIVMLVRLLTLLGN